MAEPTDGPEAVFINDMTIDPSDLHTFSVGQGYWLVADNDIVGRALTAFDDLVDLIDLDSRTSPIPPGGQYPHSPVPEGIHRLAAGATFGDLVAEHGLALRPIDPLRSGQVAVAYGPSRERAERAWQEQALQDGYVLEDHALQVEEVKMAAGLEGWHLDPSTHGVLTAIWRAAGRVRTRKGDG